jgi:hypothetical protein
LGKGVILFSAQIVTSFIPKAISGTSWKRKRFSRNERAEAPITAEKLAFYTTFIFFTAG